MNESVKEIVKRYDVIFIDMFDTLVIRDTIKPTDIFELVGGKLFKYSRIFAEIISRKISNDEDIDIDNIYSFLPSKYKEKEIEKEYQLCRANPEIKEVFDFLKKQGKKIYVVSDMYLPKEVLEGILQNCGYCVDGVYVSSQYKKNKATGNLFKCVIDELGIKAEDVIHIGDNEKADKQGASIVGIESILLPKRTNLLQYSKMNKKNIVLRGFINNGLHEIDSRAQRLGYEILGPILVCFCQWINNKKSQYNFEKIFFMSRDMHIVFDVYKTLYGGDDIEYMYVSRKSLNSAIDDSTNLCTYLEKIGFSGNVAVVDTGWRCVAQPILEYYAKMNNSESSVGGLYMGAKTGFKYIKRDKKSESCFFNTNMDLIKSQTISSFIEEMIGIVEDKVICYDCEGTPVFNKEEKKIQQMRDFQNGALKFVRDWSSLKHNSMIYSQEAFLPYLRIEHSPLDIDIDLFGDAEYDDVKTTRIVNYNRENYCRGNIKNWLYDLRFSAWKGAFFKKTFKRFYRLPYWGYLILDSLFLAYKDKKTFEKKCVNDLIRYY